MAAKKPEVIPHILSPEDFARQCAKDPQWFIEACLRVVPREGGPLVQFRLNSQQAEVIRLIWRDWSAGKPVRVIVLKARRMGISTLIEAFLYWMASTRAHTDTLIVAHELKSSRNLLQIASRFLTHDLRHQKRCMPETATHSVEEICFDQADWRQRAFAPGLDSRLRIATADSKFTARGFGLQGIHGSEVAYWQRPELLASIIPTIPDSPNTLAVLESTANGTGGVFYDVWSSAVAGDNEWTPIFLSWREFKEYSVRLTEKQKERFVLTVDEENIVKEHGLTVEQIAWRRRKMASPECQGQGRDPADIFREQYPLNADEAFVGSQKQYFDVGRVMAGMDASKAREPVLCALTNEGELTWQAGRPKITVRETRGGFLSVWKLPEEGIDYTIGADVGAGIKGGDFSVAYVMRRDSLEYVARFRAILDPERYRDEIIRLAWFYNEAFLAPEANNLGITVARGCAQRYRRTCYYVRLDEMDYGTIDEDKPGWWTTPKNRREMVGLLRQAVLDKHVVIWDPEFWAEAGNFVVPTDHDGSMQEARPRARPGKKDDCVMAATITLYVNDPRIAGPVRKPKTNVAGPRTAWEAALQKDVAAEKGKNKKTYDVHLGGLW